MSQNDLVLSYSALISYNSNPLCSDWEAALRANPDYTPVVLAYEPADGPIYAVDFSPFHRNLFLACGADGTVRMYHQYQAAPCLTVTPPVESSADNAAPLLAVKWSPKRPLVFAVCTTGGLVCLYDLSRRWVGFGRTD